MIGAAAVLVLLGLGLFVGGLATGARGLFWACVGVCAVAAVLLVVARRRDAGPPAGRRLASATTGDGESPDVQSDTPPVPPPTVRPSTPPVPPPAVRSRTPPDPPPAGGSWHSADSGPGAPGSVARPAGDGATGDGPGSVPASAAGGAEQTGEPPVEDVEVTDLLLVMDLTDEVLVVDEHPRYHVPGCRHLAGHPAIPLPLDEARTDGFTPCGLCAPDRTLAQRVRARRAAGNG